MRGSKFHLLKKPLETIISQRLLDLLDFLLNNRVK